MNQNKKTYNDILYLEEQIDNQWYIIKQIILQHEQLPNIHDSYSKDTLMIKYNQKSTWPTTIHSEIRMENLDSM